jgi:hypothetical protein
MSLALVWKDLSLQQVENVSALLSDKAKAIEFVHRFLLLLASLFSFNSPFSCRFLAQTFQLSLEENGADSIILDYYYYNLVFAEECGFTAEKISTFFSIMKQTFYKSCGFNDFHPS